MPSRPDMRQTPEDVRAALCEWHGAVRALRDLARRQLSCLEAAPGEEPDMSLLGAILAEKEMAFQRAEALSVLAVDMEAAMTPDMDRTEIERERAGLSADLTELAELEACSKERLVTRLAVVRSELDRCRRGRDMTLAYAPESAASPRFLDQRR